MRGMGRNVRYRREEIDVALDFLNLYLYEWRLYSVIWILHIWSLGWIRCWEVKQQRLNSYFIITYEAISQYVQFS